MGPTDDRSPTVTTRLSLVIDLERLGPVATGIAAAAPKRTIPTSPLHHAGSTGLTNDDAGLSLGRSILGEHSGLFSVATTGGSSHRLIWGQVRWLLQLVAE